MALLRCSLARSFRRSLCVSASCFQTSSVSPRAKLMNNYLGSADNLSQYEEHRAHKNVVVLIVDALTSGNREKASMLLWKHMPRSIKHDLDEFTCILQCCARYPDPLFAMETWKFMEKNSITLDNICLSYIIEALSEGGHLKQAFDLLSSLGDTDRATIPMYNLYLRRCIRSRSLSQAGEALQLMESQLMGKSEVTYLLLLELAVWQEDLSHVHSISRDFHKFYQPSMTSIEKFIWAYSKLGDFKSASSALRHMVALVSEESASNTSSRGCFSCRPDIPIPSNTGLLNGRCSFPFTFFKSSKENGEIACRTDLKVLHEDNVSFNRNVTSEVQSLQLTPSLPKDPEHNLSFDSNATELHDPWSTFCRNSNMLPTSGNRLRTAGWKLLKQSFHHMLRGCIKWKNYDLTEQLFLQMNDFGLQPSASSCDAFVRAIVPKRGAVYGKKVIEAMAKRNLKPFDTSIGALIIEHSKALEFELAEELLCQIDRKSLFLCNALLDAYYKVDKPERALWLLKRMKQWNVKPDTKTYELLFLLFGNVNSSYEDGDDFSCAEVKKRIHAIETDMIRNGVGHNSFTLENLIKVLGSEGLTKEVLQYLSMAEVLFSSSYRGTITYNIALQAHVAARQSNVAIGLFNKMRSQLIPLDAATYNIMLDCCSILKSYKFALALVSAMLRDGYLPTAHTYCTLIKTVLANQDFDEVLRLLDQAFAEGLEMDAHIFSTVIQEAAMKGFLDVMELMLEQMHCLRIPPTPSICANAILAYATQGFHTMATDALQVLSMRMISTTYDDDKEGTLLQEQQARYEDLLLCEDEEAAVEKLLVERFLRPSETNVGMALMSLRWCMLLGMGVSWRPSESPWARRLAAGQYLSR